MHGATTEGVYNLDTLPTVADPGDDAHAAHLDERAMFVVWVMLPFRFSPLYKGSFLYP